MIDNKSMMSRRRIITQTGTITIAAALIPTVAFGSDCPTTFMNIDGPRCRVVIVNDLSGDIDGLFATAHALLSTSTELRAIVGSCAAMQSETATRSTQLAREILQLTGKNEMVAVYEGASTKLLPGEGPQRSAGIDAIIAEARRTDSKLPLYIAVGGGLTEIASALMIAPDIANRLTLIWIGGNSYPNGGGGEYNFKIDPVACRYVYNESRVTVWQIPSDVYAACQVSAAELQTRVRPYGPLGEWLYRKFVGATQHMSKIMNTGEGWTLGDSPLVLLTALTSWVPSNIESSKYELTGSSRFLVIPAPRLRQDGDYEPQQSGRPIRIYQNIDTRMMFEDFFQKLRIHSCAQLYSSP